MVFRFANGLFEPIWNRRYVDHVQMLVAETVGVEDRGNYYETAGVVRDMIQNHMLQVLALIAMEPPASFDPDAIRDEKVKVLKSIRPMTPEEILSPAPSAASTPRARSPLQTPVAVVTGTDLSTGARFEFSQDTFDLLCSDLGSVRLARAAATSSAVPVLLSPVTYRNYGGKCDAMLPIWVQDVANREHAARPAGRALLRYRDFKALEDSENRPYLHIVDGAFSDNLGLRGMLEALEQLEASPAFQHEMRFSELRHIVVIAVNSRSAPATDWDRKPAPPGIVSQLIQASSVPIDHFSFESVEVLRDMAARWADRRELAIARRLDAGQSRTEAEASVPRITFDAIDVSFDAIEDSSERREFMEMPTTFFLPAESIDRLRELGGRLLRNSRPYKILLQRIAEIEKRDTPSAEKPSSP